MEWYHVGAGLLALLMLFIGLGLPIPFALAAASMPFLFYIQGWSTALVSSELNLWRVWIVYILLAVPLFVRTYARWLVRRADLDPGEAAGSAASQHGGRDISRFAGRTPPCSRHGSGVKTPSSTPAEPTSCAGTLPPWIMSPPMRA